MEKTFVIGGKVATLHFVTSPEDGWFEVGVKVNGRFTPAFETFTHLNEDEARQAFKLVAKTLATLAAEIGH